MSFCAGCIDLKELTSLPAPKGSIEKIGGLDVYVAKGSKKGTILLFTDIYGISITNPKQVADKLAADSGLSVYVPDYFKGDAIKPEDFELPQTAESGPPSDEKMQKNFGAFTQWMGRDHGPDKVYPLVKPVIEAVDGPKFGLGYCYGAKIAVLAALDKLISGVALYHASLLEASEADKIDVPVLLNEAELDPLFAGELKEAWESKLKAKNLLDSRTKLYPNTVHGFGCRPDLKNDKVAKGWEESVKNTADFFASHA